MLDANYARHFKVLGKLAKLYDLAAAQVTADNALLAAFVDQYADGTPASLPAVALFPAYTSQISNSISNGSANLKAVALSAAGAYLVNTTFTADLSTPIVGNTAAASLTALATEMSEGEDDKTLTTLASTGLVNFFDAIAGSAGSWNTEADATADYKDSVYVVSSVV